MGCECEDSLKKVDQIVIEKYDADPENLIHILQEVNSEFNYLPEPAICRVAEGLKIPLSQVYGVATFYKALSLEPRGEHVITACLGTACHVRGGQRMVEKLERDLDIKAGETTPDMKFTLETVSCLGCCALAPVIVVDEKYHGKIDSGKLKKVMKSYE
jgi:NADH-quinone oxidoreductase subunit E